MTKQYKIVMTALQIVCIALLMWGIHSHGFNVGRLQGVEEAGELVRQSLVLLENGEVPR